MAILKGEFFLVGVQSTMGNITPLNKHLENGKMDNKTLRYEASL